MESQSTVPRIGQTLTSIGLGLVLVCGVLLLFGTVTPLASAAPVLPDNTPPSLAPQAIVPVTTTIQAAINAATSGDTVVFTGTYTEEVVINKPLTLQGAFPTSTIVYNGAAFPLSPTIHVTTGTVTVTNMTLTGAGLVQHSGILVENSSNVSVSGVTIQNYPTGIIVQRTAAGPGGITITNNTILDPAGNSGEPGLHLVGSGPGQGTIQATIQSNQMSGYAPLINAEGLAPTLILSNVLTTTGYSFDGAIRLNQAGPSLVQDNSLVVSSPPASTTLSGIFVGNTANPTVTQNSIASQFTFGIEVNDSATPVITNSTLTAHGGAGVRVAGSAAPQVFGNIITGNLNGISVGSLSSLVTASGNTICQNTSFGLRSSSTYPSQPAIGNWWGHNPPLDSGAPPSDYRPNVNASLPISMALSLTPTPTLISINDTVAITLTMRGGGYNVLDGTGISFSATGGSFVVTDTTTLAGQTSTTYLGTVLGSHTVTATDDCGGLITTTVTVAEPVLTTTKTAAPPTGSVVSPGDPITYTIYVTNTGAFTASGVVFSDTIPTFTQLATATIDTGTIDLTDPVSATFDPIPPNNGVMSVTLRVTVTLPLTNGTLLTNTASISYFNGTTNIITPTNSVTHRVSSSPNITLTKRAQPPHGSDVSPGDSITYTIAITNLGNANATGLLISDTIPASTALVSTSSTPNVSVTPGDPLRADITFLPAPTGTALITFTVRVTSPLPTNTLITNTAQVTSTETPGLITYSNQVTHRVRSAPLLIGVKTAEPPSGSVVRPTDTITYHLVITNIGDADAAGVGISDGIPAEVNFVPGSLSVVNGTVLSIPPPTLLVLASILTGTSLNGTQSSIQATLAVTVTTPLTNGTQFTNTAAISYFDGPAFVLTATNPVTHVVQSSPDMTITKSAVPPSGSLVGPGETITYTIVVTNNGTANATGVVISDTLDPNVNLVTSSTTTGTLSGPNPVQVTGFNLNVGQSVTVTLGVTVTDNVSGTVISNRASVTSTQSTSLQVSGLVTHVISSTIPPPPSFTLTKSTVPLSGSSVEPDDTITYTIVITNDGPSNATAVVISDTLDPNVNLVASSTTTGTLSGPNPVQVTGFNLNVGQSVTITLGVTVTGNASGTVISNRASVTSTQSTALQVSNVVTHVISNTIPLSPSFTLTKSAGPPSGSSVDPGDTITYTVVVTNNGGPASNVFLTDLIPAGTAYVTGSATTSFGSVEPFDGTRLRFSMPSFTTNVAMTATFRVTVATMFTTTLSNMATLTSTQTGPDNSNVVTHTVRGTMVASNTYLPLILRDFDGSSVILQWDGLLDDRVSDADGAAGLITDTVKDGRFTLSVTLGSGGPKFVESIRLTSDQGVEWDTLTPNANPVLGIFSGAAILNSTDGTISGVLFGSGPVTVQLYASDDTSTTPVPRFPPDTFTYTVIIKFTDGSTLPAQTRIPP